MKLRFSLFVLLTGFLLFCLQHSAWTQDRRPSYPLITGDGFRDSSSFIYDETDGSFSPSLVARGDSIFVKWEYLEEFFREIHPKISYPYVLITHNSDYPPPDSCQKMLDDEKLLAWFAQNIQNYTHKKLIPIPIGLENRYNSRGNPDVVLAAMEQCKNVEKTLLLYMNFSIHNFYAERSRVFNMFQNAPYCVSLSGRDYGSLFLRDLAQSKFVLCPRGNGLDTHRAWEALYMGSIPVIKSSNMDSVFDDLPVVIVQDWDEISEEFLLQKYEEMSQRSYNFEKLYMSYWTSLIKSFINPF